jgi:hypothetical protein
MTWSVSVQNNSGRAVIAPAVANQYTQGYQAIVTVDGLGGIQLLDVGHVAGGPHYWAVQVTTGKFSGMWYYDGGGLCTLTLNPDGTFRLEGQGQTLSGEIGGPSPLILPLPAGTRVYVNAFTNAGFLQRVTLTVNGGGINQWQGTGEGNNELANAPVDTPKDSSGWVTTSALVEFSNNGGASWNRSKVSPVGSFTIYGYNQRTIVSEDADDDDYNDVAIIMSWWVAPPTR